LIADVVSGYTEGEGGKEEYDQLPSYEIVPEDSRTAQEG